MNVMPIGLMPPYNPNFGIYKSTEITHYGHILHGQYKTNLIDIYVVKEPSNPGTKLFYIADKCKNFLMSKLIWFDKGHKKSSRAYGRVYHSLEDDIVKSKDIHK